MSTVIAVGIFYFMSFVSTGFFFTTHLPACQQIPDGIDFDNGYLKYNYAKR